MFFRLGGSLYGKLGFFLEDKTIAIKPQCLINIPILCSKEKYTPVCLFVFLWLVHHLKVEKNDDTNSVWSFF